MVLSNQIVVNREYSLTDIYLVNTFSDSLFLMEKRRKSLYIIRLIIEIDKELEICYYKSH